MPINVEIKARVHDSAGLRARLGRVAKAPALQIEQEDIFFNVPRGRLKLRILNPERGELIYYERADGPGPRTSQYWLSEVGNPAALAQVLTAALGQRGIVRKTRTLQWVGNTRVHLDQVEHLGSFVELEVVLSPGETAAQGERIATDLMAQLGIASGDLIRSAYIDLLQEPGT